MAKPRKCRKVYPLYVEELRDIDNGERNGFYSKGWHDPQEFLLAVEREFEVADMGMILSPMSVSHIYLRNEFFGERTENGPMHILVPHYKQVRCSFPATMIDCWTWEKASDDKSV